MPATKDNFQHCNRCHRALPRLLAAEQVHFCNPDCCHEWSSSVLGAERPAATYEVMNRLRQYLAATLSHNGMEVTFLRLCIAAQAVFTELNLKALMAKDEIATAIYGEAEEIPPDGTDPEIQFP